MEEEALLFKLRPLEIVDRPVDTLLSPDPTRDPFGLGLITGDFGPKSDVFGLTKTRDGFVFVLVSVRGAGFDGFGVVSKIYFILDFRF